MRKSRTVVNDVEVHWEDNFGNQPQGVQHLLDNLGIPVPDWVKFMLVSGRDDALDFSFFEDVGDFYVWYTKTLMRRRAKHTASFQHEAKQWTIFVPPTLIGVDLRTKLRI